MTDEAPTRNLRREGDIPSRPGDRWYHGLAIFLPGFAVYALLVLLPAGVSVWYSLHDWAGFGEASWVGLANYRRLLGDALFWRALANNAAFIVFYTVVPITLGLLLAAVLHQPWLRGRGTFRALLFLPQILPMALIGVIWRWMYAPGDGPINAFLAAIGLGALTRPWLGDFDWALPSVGLIASWYFYGFCMAVFFAGMQRIDPTLYDAARVDGASALRQLLHVTLPGLRREIVVVAFFTLVTALKVFDLVFVTTRGGPGDSTLVGTLYLYRSAFQRSEVGYASTIAVVLTILVILVTVMLRRLQRSSS
ncbi:MAG: sugar ABC transporter permease [Trueperaceae bacterium]|nr:sugar ABC transporter permease [Trueperaceae bacterium]